MAATMFERYGGFVTVRKVVSDFYDRVLESPVALRMRRYLERRNRSHPGQWLARIGLHTGPVIGSMVGVQKYVYDVFGPGVNLAARMERVSQPMKITISEDFRNLVRDEFETTDLGEVEIKGFGTQRIYALESESY